MSKKPAVVKFYKLGSKKLCMLQRFLSLVCPRVRVVPLATLAQPKRTAPSQSFGEDAPASMGNFVHNFS